MTTEWKTIEVCYDRIAIVLQTRLSMSSATISFRIPLEVKNSVKPILEANGMSVSELCQSVLEYAAETGKIPVKRELLSEEDRELIRLTLERLTEPGSIPVKLEDL